MHACMHMLRVMRITPQPGAISGYCERTGISRDELARRMGISKESAYRVDKGDSDPSPAFIAKLMDLTGLGFDDLFVIDKSESVA